MNLPVYLDNHATTPIDPNVLAAMKPYLEKEFGNPGSRTHEYGIRANQAVEQARTQVSRAIGAFSSKEIIFVSGATEANNLAIRGLVPSLIRDKKKHIVTAETEHKSVLDVVLELENQGIEVTRIAPVKDGLFDLQVLEKAIRPDTGLISIMHANNETGVVSPIQEIGKIAEKNGILLHCDAAQSVGKVPVSVQKMKIHLLSLSAHKIYGPKGVGALYVRQSSPRVGLSPILYGGGQERGLRSGTLAPFLIVGLGEACRIAVESMSKESKDLEKLRDHLLDSLKAGCDDLVVNGSLKSRLPNNLNVSFPGVDSEALMHLLRPKIAVSNGSACTSLNWKSSHVLEAMGVEENLAKGTIRFGLGRFNTREEVDFAAEEILGVIQSLRQIAR